MIPAIDAGLRAEVGDLIVNARRTVVAPRSRGRNCQRDEHRACRDGG
jgi:hypothetical protein